MKGERYFSSAASQIRHSLGIALDVDVDVKDDEGEEETKKSEEEDDDETETKGGLLPILSLLTSTLRNLRLPSSRSACLELIASLGQYVKDEIVLQRLVPYVSL